MMRVCSSNQGISFCICFRSTNLFFTQQHDTIYIYVEYVPLSGFWFLCESDFIRIFAHEPLSIFNAPITPPTRLISRHLYIYVISLSLLSYYKRYADSVLGGSCATRNRIVKRIKKSDISLTMMLLFDTLNSLLAQVKIITGGRYKGDGGLFVKRVIF